MRKLLLIFVFFTLTQLNAFSQKLYLKGAFSISTAAAPMQYNTSYSYYFPENSSNRTEYQVEKGSYGAGLRSIVGLGTMLTDNIGFELETSYLRGAPQKSYFEMYVEDNSDKSITSSSGRLLAFVPSLLVTAKRSIISPYAKAGVLIGRPRVVQETIRTIKFGQTYISTFEVNGKTALGLQGAIGVKCNISEKFSLFSEITFATLSFTPVKGKTTAYKVNEEDFMHIISEFEKTTDYVTSFSTDDNIDATKPRKSFNSPLPFNFVGVQIGLQFNLLDF